MSETESERDIISLLSEKVVWLSLLRCNTSSRISICSGPV